MVMNKNNRPRKGLWVTGLAIQGIAVLLLGRYLITLDLPTNIISLIVLFAAYIAIVVPTTNVVRGKTKSTEFIITIGVFNIITTFIAIGFLAFVAGLYDTLHY